MPTKKKSTITTKAAAATAAAASLPSIKRRVKLIVTCKQCGETAFLTGEKGDYVCAKCGTSIGDDSEVYPWQAYVV